MTRKKDAVKELAGQWFRKFSDPKSGVYALVNCRKRKLPPDYYKNI